MYVREQGLFMKTRVATVHVEVAIPTGPRAMFDGATRERLRIRSSPYCQGSHEKTLELSKSIALWWLKLTERPLAMIRCGRPEAV
jgi:hypothetical protein